MTRRQANGATRRASRARRRRSAQRAALLAQQTPKKRKSEAAKGRNEDESTEPAPRPCLGAPGRACHRFTSHPSMRCRDCERAHKIEAAP